MTLKLGTKFLFHRLLKAVQPDMVCDIGSMDASDARRFRRLLPHARIVAFEGNPDNVMLLRRDQGLEKAGIDIQAGIVGNRDGTQTFYIEKLSEGEDTEDVRRGISSTRARTRNSLGNRVIETDAMRLDTFIQNLDSIPSSVALWIDVEGAAYEVLEGIENVRQRIKLIHVEVETEVFWEGQRLKDDVEDLMRSMGFITLARGHFEPQHDLVLINEKTFLASPFTYKWLLYSAWVFTNRLKIFSKSAYNLNPA